MKYDESASSILWNQHKISLYALSLFSISIKCVWWNCAKITTTFNCLKGLCVLCRSFFQFWCACQMQFIFRYLYVWNIDSFQREDCKTKAKLRHEIRTVFFFFCTRRNMDWFTVNYVVFLLLFLSYVTNTITSFATKLDFLQELI